MNIPNTIENAGDTASDGATQKTTAQGTTPGSEGGTTPQPGGNAKKGVDRLLRKNNDLHKGIENEKTKRIAAEKELAALRNNGTQETSPDIATVIDNKFNELKQDMAATERDKAGYQSLRSKHDDVDELIPDMEKIAEFNPNLSPEGLYILAKDGNSGDAGTTQQSKSLAGAGAGDAAYTPNDINSQEDMDRIAALPKEQAQAERAKYINKREL